MTGFTLPVAMLAQMSSQSPDFVRSAFAKFTGVAQLVGLYQTGGLFSDRRLMRSAEQLLHQATVQMIVLEADGTKSKLEPTPEQIEEQFKKFQDVDPGAGEHGFGYRLPDRVKLEWLDDCDDQFHGFDPEGLRIILPAQAEPRPRAICSRSARYRRRDQSLSD